MSGSGEPGATTVGALLAGAALPASEARILLAHASGRPVASLVARPEALVERAVADAFVAAAHRRRAGEPIAYLVGRREFYGRAFAVSPAVLIPRPETELLVDAAIAAIDRLPRRDRPARVLDLGTGSGAIAVSIAAERAGCDVVATDRSLAALDVARRNADRLGVVVRFAAGDWFDAVDADERFDVIVGNPPYVAAGDPHLTDGDLRFEPVGALTDDGDGLDALRTIVGEAPRFLTAGGTLAVEHGHDQARSVRALFAAAGFVHVASEPDLAGIERITRGRRPTDRRGAPGNGRDAGL